MGYAGRTIINIWRKNVKDKQLDKEYVSNLLSISAEIARALSSIEKNLILLDKLDKGDAMITIKCATVLHFNIAENIDITNRFEGEARGIQEKLVESTRAVILSEYEKLCEAVTAIDVETSDI